MCVSICWHSHRICMVYIYNCTDMNIDYFKIFWKWDLESLRIWPVKGTTGNAIGCVIECNDSVIANQLSDDMIPRIDRQREERSGRSKIMYSDNLKISSTVD